MHHSVWLAGQLAGRRNLAEVRSALAGRIMQVAQLTAVVLPRVPPGLAAALPNSSWPASLPRPHSPSVCPPPVCRHPAVPAAHVVLRPRSSRCRLSARPLWHRPAHSQHPPGQAEASHSCMQVHYTPNWPLPPRAVLDSQNKSRRRFSLDPPDCTLCKHTVHCAQASEKAEPKAGRARARLHDAPAGMN